MLTGDTKRVSHRDMFFKPLIDRWGALDLAKALGLPAKNIRSWENSDSIPAEWFNAIARASDDRGFTDITVEALADLSEKRRLARSTEAVPQANAA